MSVQDALQPAWPSIAEQAVTIKDLNILASKHPYYKYNGMWTRQMQDMPSDVKDQDTFHITTEEYLHALISLIEELARLAVNSVTLGDYQKPLQISKFVKDVHAGFQILNLKNDSLRRRSDSIKYSVRMPPLTTDTALTIMQVKKVEDVVYDLSLRNLITRS
ncbi:MAG: hypothetical protein Q9220_005704 [cf. Caloplaca sp. 1 TL-2023]